jgi:hypothetical protein
MAEETSRIQVATTKHFATSAIIAAMIAAILCGGLHLYETKVLRCPPGVYRNPNPPPPCIYGYYDATGSYNEVGLDPCPRGC